MDLDGAYVEIIAGTGAGQVRRIVSNTSTKLRLDRAWDVTPDTTSQYQIGGIPAALKLKFSNLGLPAQVKRMKFLTVTHKREALGSSPKVRVYQELLDENYYDNKGIPSPSFQTNRSGQSQVGLQDAAGYNLSLEIEANGPEAPLELRHLTAVMEAGEKD